MKTEPLFLILALIQVPFIALYPDSWSNWVAAAVCLTLFLAQAKPSED